MLTFAAKKRAEVAPGVGKGTDMFTIGPQLGSHITLWPAVIGKLEKIHTESERRRAAANLRSEAQVKNYLDELVQAAKDQAEK